MTAELPFVAGRCLRDYLRDPELRKYSVLGVAIRSRRLDQDRRRLKMRSTLSDHTTVYLLHRDQT